MVLIPTGDLFFAPQATAVAATVAAEAAEGERVLAESRAAAKRRAVVEAQHQAFLADLKKQPVSISLDERQEAVGETLEDWLDDSSGGAPPVLIAALAAEI